MSVLLNLIFDSITNTVFAGQVYEPLLRMLDSEQITHAYLISFESHETYKIACERAKELTHHDKLTVIIKRRWPFICSFLLRIMARRLRVLLKKFTKYQIIARGPLAGVVAQYALDRDCCTRLTIQARGLLAQEYRYVHIHKVFIAKIFFKLRELCYERVERTAYKKSQPCLYRVQVVTHALAQYLITHFGTDKNFIELAVHDTPAIILPEFRALWRERVRLQLAISPKAYVYCFVGSAHAWQLPETVVNYFYDKYLQDNSSFLLLLTADKSMFERLLSKKGIARDAYKIMWVAHTQVYEYLSAADAGLLFRDHGLINWVSRPVKAMEYAAAGLPIIHNNTVAWLIKRHGINAQFANSP